MWTVQVACNGIFFPVPFAILMVKFSRSLQLSQFPSHTFAYTPHTHTQKISFHFQMRVCVNVQIWFIEIVCIEHIWGFQDMFGVCGVCVKEFESEFFFSSALSDQSPFGRCWCAGISSDGEYAQTHTHTHNIENHINIIRIEIEWQNLFVPIFHLNAGYFA